MNALRLLAAISRLVIFVDSTDWVDTVIRYIAEDTGIRHVMLVKKFSQSSASSILPINELIEKSFENIPTTIIGDSMASGKTSFEKAIDENTRKDTSRTLFLIIEESGKRSNNLPSRGTIDALLPIARWKFPKYILVLITPEARDSLEELLKYTWSKKLLDFEIVELVDEKKAAGLGLPFKLPEPIVHRYNPFKKEYTRVSWTPKMEWFPEKGQNMYGYELKIGVDNYRPFTVVRYAEDGETVIGVRGAYIEIAEALAKQLNFTANYLSTTRFMELKRNPTPSGTDDLMGSGKLDMHAVAGPHTGDWEKNRFPRLAPLSIESLCAVVPILPSFKFPAMKNFIRLHGMFFLIAIAFWALRYFMKFEPRIWQPLNVVGVLFGVGVARQPSRNAERIMFLCLLVVGFVYSSNMYSALTDVSFQMADQMEINSFEDLDESGLTPIIKDHVFNKTFARSKGPLLNIAKKTIIASDMEGCAQRVARYKNITCLTARKKVIHHLHDDKKLRESIKIVEPCFWWDTISFRMADNSPYIPFMNRIIGHLHSSGLVGKWYAGIGSELHGADEHSEDENSDDVITGNRKSKKLLHQLMVIAVVGYTSASFVFVGEILLHRFSRYARSVRGK